MANPTIVFNNSTGSDTAASGAGPATAVTGTAAAHTGGSATTTITLTNSPDLSGVATDGSHALWLKTASGRQYSRINAKDNTAKTLTVDDTFTIASGSAVNYAVGGKRSTLDHADSRTLFTDSIKVDWTAEVQYTGTNYTISSTITTIDQQGFLLLGTGSQRPTLEGTANSSMFRLRTNTGNIKFIRAINTNATKTASVFIDNDDYRVRLFDCQIGSATSSERWWRGVVSSYHFCLYNCRIFNCVDSGVQNGRDSHLIITASSIDSNGGDGIKDTASATVFIVSHSWLTGNAGHGIASESTNTVALRNNTFANNGGAGYKSTRGDSSGQTVLNENNSFTGNGGYGVDLNTQGTGFVLANRYNNYYSNTSGARNNLAAGVNDFALDPQYLDAANRDFTPQTLTLRGVPQGMP